MDYYKVLGIKPSAGPVEIRNAYKEQALYYHPDRNLNNVKLAEKKFKEVSNAYQVLSDPELKEKYDSNTHQTGSVASNDPFEIFYQMFPMLRDPIIRHSLLDKLTLHFSSVIDSSWGNLITTMIVNNHERKSNPEPSELTKRIFDITVPVTLMDHYAKNFQQDISVTFDQDVNFSLTVDTRQTYNQRQTIVPYQSGNMDVTLNITCKYEPDVIFEPLRGDGDILHIINISTSEFIKGFRYTLPYFGKTLSIFLSQPYQDNMGYVLEGYGIPYDNESTGNLFLKLMVDPAKDSVLITDTLEQVGDIIPTPLTFVVLEKPNH